MTIPVSPVFYCNQCNSKEDVRVYPNLMRAYCATCADGFGWELHRQSPSEQRPVAPSLKQRFGDWIDARTAQGIETYGTPLMTENGRDARNDAFEELLDFCQYQEQSRLELLADNARLRQRIGVARERLGLPELENYTAGVDST